MASSGINLELIMKKKLLEITKVFLKGFENEAERLKQSDTPIPLEALEVIQETKDEIQRLEFEISQFQDPNKS